MASKSVQAIKTAVRNLLDIHDENALVAIEDQDAMDMDTAIQQCICPAIRIIHGSAPISKLEGKSFAEKTITWQCAEGYGSGYVELPSDFMRLVLFRMSDWLRGVYTPIEETSEEYLVQSSIYAGLRGSYQKPVCALIKGQSGIDQLQFFSSYAGTNGTSGQSGSHIGAATIERALYVPMPVISNGNVDISGKCYDSFLYECAHLVNKIFGVEDTFETIAMQLLNA